MHTPDHDLLPLAGEAGWVQLREVLLDEAEHQHVAQGCERDDQDDNEGDEGDDVTGSTAHGGYLTRLECTTCQNVCWVTILILYMYTDTNAWTSRTSPLHWQHYIITLIVVRHCWDDMSMKDQSAWVM